MNELFEMVNFLNQLNNPQINYKRFFEIMRDFRKGGLHPDMYDEFLESISSLPPITRRSYMNYRVFDKFNLKDLSQEDFKVILKELKRRSVETNKICWHPLAGRENCKLDSSGQIKIIKAHSIQENGILSQIAEDHFVTTYEFDNGGIGEAKVKKAIASIFFGFCNRHDSMFNPIETKTYEGTVQQNFLFAYRGFVVAAHKKREGSYFLNYGEQSEKDILENKKIFDEAILNEDFSIIESGIIELEKFYPIAVSSSFYLDYDFEGNEIFHSEDRMENIFITLLPSIKENKTYFILSYFKQDANLYSKLIEQLKKRGSLKSDISMIIAAHAENVYYNPIYYDTFIRGIEEEIHELIFQTQYDHGHIDSEGAIEFDFSYTPNDYLKNKFGINLFGY